MNENSNGENLNKKVNADEAEKMVKEEKESHELIPSSEKELEELTNEYLADINTKVENLSAEKEKQMSGLKEQAVELNDEKINSLTKNTENQLAEVEKESKETAEKAKKEITDNVEQKNNTVKEKNKKKPENKEEVEKLKILDKALEHVDSISKDLTDIRMAGNNFIEQSLSGLNRLLQIVENGDRRNVLFREVKVMGDNLYGTRKGLILTRDEISYLGLEGKKISDRIRALSAEAKKSGESKLIAQKIQESEASLISFLKITGHKIEDIKKRIRWIVVQIEDNYSHARIAKARAAEFLSKYSPSVDVSQTIVGDYWLNSMRLKNKIEGESLLISKRIRDYEDNIKIATRRIFR